MREICRDCTCGNGSPRVFSQPTGTHCILQLQQCAVCFCNLMFQAHAGVSFDVVSPHDWLPVCHLMLLAYLRINCIHSSHIAAATNIFGGHQSLIVGGCPLSSGAGSLSADFGGWLHSMPHSHCIGRLGQQVLVGRHGAQHFDGVWGDKTLNRCR